MFFNKILKENIHYKIYFFFNSNRNFIFILRIFKIKIELKL
jgi:hypothetical protein